jgi:hypothetical protein
MMLRSLRLAVTVTALLATAAVSWGQDTATKRDTRGPVTVAVTLLAPPAAGEPLRVKVVLDTHSVGLDSVDFLRAVALRSADGGDVAPTAVEASGGGGHHREAVLVFAAPAAGPVRLVVRGVGGVPERSFEWAAPAGR